MKLHNLSTIVTKSSKRRGRGYGSGKGGHTVGRGQKGQKARGKVPAWFIGTSWVWFKRLPMIKGKGRFKSLKPSSRSLSLSLLDNHFKEGETVSPQTLLNKGLITPSQLKFLSFKILANGSLTKKLKVVHVPASRQAIKLIQQAGGEYLS